MTHDAELTGKCKEDFEPASINNPNQSSINIPKSVEYKDASEEREILKPRPAHTRLYNNEPESGHPASIKASPMDPSLLSSKLNGGETKKLKDDSGRNLATKDGYENVPEARVFQTADGDLDCPRDLTSQVPDQENGSSKEEASESSQSPNEAPSQGPQKQSWRRPQQNTWRMGHVCLAFLNFGLNDASYGALLPTLETYYSISYTVVSLIFLCTFFGYTFSALANDALHHSLGRRGAAFLSPLCRLIAYTLLSCHLPWGAIIVGLVICGVGNGIAEGAWNAWLGNLENSNELLGILHGCYGLGATISPVVATSMVSAGLGWWEFYYILLGTNALEILYGTGIWWGSSGRVFREGLKESSETSDDEGEGEAEGGAEKEGGRMKEALKNKVVWLIAAFFFSYVGAEVSLGGFIPSFLLSIRTDSLFSAGTAATGFWAGLTAGRVTLGFITPHIGERKAISAYLVVAVALQLIFWLVPSFAVSAAAVALLGFFIGPLFPSAVVVGTKILPERLHVVGIGFAAAVGGGGAAVLPFAVGAIAQARGVASLEPIVLAILVLLLGLWWMFPRIPKDRKKGGDQAGDKRAGWMDRWRKKRRRVEGGHGEV